jgi:hypothetical protein
LATAYRPTHDYCFELSLVFLIANAINVGHAWRYAANINRRITVSFKKRYTRSRISEELAAEIAEEFVVAELTGTKTHGVGKLVSLQFGDLAAKPNYSGTRRRHFRRRERRKWICIISTNHRTREQTLFGDGYCRRLRA